MEEQKLNNESRYKIKKNNNVLYIVSSIVILAAIVLVIFLIKQPNNISNNNYLTYSNYNKIKDGMRYSEVVEVLEGNDGKLSTSSSYAGYSLSYYEWSNSSGTKCIVVGFENGCVCVKTQYGL